MRKRSLARLMWIFGLLGLLGASSVRAAPDLRLAPISERTVRAGETVRFRASASGGQVLYSLVGGPKGAAISDDGLFVWTPTQKGLFAFEIVAASVADPKQRASTVVRVRVIDPDAPTFAEIPSQVVALGTVVRFQAKAEPKPGTLGRIVYSLANPPEGATIDAYSGRFAWRPLRAGSYELEVVAAPEGSPWLLNVQRVSITVQGVERPELEPIPARSVAVGSTYTAVARQRSGGRPMEEMVFSLKGAPDGMTIEPRSGRIQWTPRQPGTYSFTVVGTSTADAEVQASASSEVRVFGVFGSNFFDAARAMLQGRMAAMRDGKFVPGTATIMVQQGEAKASETVEPLRNFVGPEAMAAFNVATPDPERYQLGPGDVLKVRFWSPAFEPKEHTVKVDARGVVSLPDTNVRAVVRGRTLGQAESLLRSELRRLIRNADVLVQLEEVRTMAITVMGEAYQPGRYQVPSVATLFNAVYLFGGPTDDGSFRRIELRRSDGTRRVLDLYRYLLGGDASQDTPLQPGDAIFVPRAERRVVVSGEVARPGVYEILPGETLRDAVRMAGGLRPTAVADAALLETVGESGSLPGRVLLRLDLDRAGVELKDGDVLDVPSLPSAILNEALVEGAVERPGRYPVAEGTTVAELLRLAGGLSREAWRERFDVFRRTEDGSNALVALTPDRAGREPAKPGDRVVVYRESDVAFLGHRVVEATGAVRKAGTFQRSEGMRLLDLLIQAGGLAPDANAERGFLQRTEPDGTPGELIAVDLRKALAGDPQANVELRDRDVLRVQTVAESRYLPDQTVQVLGAVQAPGMYTRASNLTLGDLLKLAGGPTPDAGDFLEIAKARVPEGTPPIRVSLKEAWEGGPASATRLEDGDFVTVPARRDFVVAPRTVTILGEVANPGPYTLSRAGETLSDLVARAGGLTAAAFPEGAQFLRNPRRLRTDPQQAVAPKVRQMIDLVNEAEYRRALARGELERTRIAAGIKSEPIVLGLPGQAAQAPPAVSIPELRGETVTPARELGLAELSPTGNVNVNLPAALSAKGGPQDLPLEDGDVIVVPQRPTTVAVTGAVVVPSSNLFVKGRNVEYYVERSGGYTLDAATDGILLIKPNGQVVRADRRTQPGLGDVIFVPTKVMAARLADRQAEVDAVSRNVTSAAVVIALLRALIP
ncbi:MAG: SLBB domain-containing protein [Fimbriimonadales bacterium]|nr:SLBB domain-containing protein [Fimbriimonadales bacterium]